jgi:protein-S-isoprenylcysteine O-methyltransferase Ste14
MRQLELKVPPPAVALLIAFAMWMLSSLMPHAVIPQAVRVDIVVAIACIGMAFGVGGSIAFHRARTTVNPMNPRKASSLVTSGIYRITRNPMYVGLLVGLFAWTVALASPVLLLGPVGFMLYINRFQIAPEERVLLELFGSEYRDYKAKVRRWL